MCQCLNMLVVHGHGRGKRLGTCLVCTTCVVAIVACKTGDGSCCPNSLYANKQHADSRQQSRSFTNKVSNKKDNFPHINIFVCDDRANYLQLYIYIQACNDAPTHSLSILYNVTHNITFVVLKLTRISFTNYNYNFAQVVHRIAFIFTTFQYLKKKRTPRFSSLGRTDFRPEIARPHGIPWVYMTDTRI